VFSTVRFSYGMGSGFLFVLILGKEFATFGSQLLFGGLGFGNGLAPGGGLQGLAGWLAVFDDRATGRGEVAGEEGALAALFFRSVGRAFNAGFKVAPGFGVVGVAASLG